MRMMRDGASSLIRKLRPGQVITLEREPKNLYNKNAILVMLGNRALGYLPRGLASQIAPLMDKGVKVIARKGLNPLYGVCQLAYIPPHITPAGAAGIDPVVQSEMATGHTPEMPPLGDSRPPAGDDQSAAEEVPYDESSPEADDRNPFDCLPDD